jgi:choline kinase
MNSVNRAILLVAGVGRRLGALTRSRPKCLVEVAGSTILERALCALAQCGVPEVVLVVGYGASQVREVAGSRFAGMRIRYVSNDLYATTNTTYSLWLARDHLDSECFLLEGDILFGTSVLEHILQSREDGRSVWAAVPLTPGNDEGILLRRGQDDGVADVQLVREPDDRCGSLTHKCAGIQLLAAPLARALARHLDEVIAEGREGLFADLVLAEVINQRIMSICSLEGMRWAEVDTPEDLRYANAFFNGARSATAVSRHA